MPWFSSFGDKVGLGIWAGEKKNLGGHFSFASHIFIGLVRFIYLYIEPNQTYFCPAYWLATQKVVTLQLIGSNPITTFWKIRSVMLISWEWKPEKLRQSKSSIVVLTLWRGLLLLHLLTGFLRASILRVCLNLNRF